MIPGVKAGAKFTITTEIRDKDGKLKERTVEEGETEEGKIKFSDKMPALGDKGTLELSVTEEAEDKVEEG